MTRSLLLCASLLTAPLGSGCYLSHALPLDGAAPDAGVPVDAPADVTVRPDAPLPPGCRAVCEPPTVLAHVALPGAHEGPSYQFADAVSVGSTIVVLTTGRYPGHLPPRHPAPLRGHGDGRGARERAVGKGAAAFRSTTAARASCRRRTRASP
jgi:hypothetical protein